MEIEDLSVIIIEFLVMKGLENQNLLLEIWTS